MRRKRPPRRVDPEAALKDLADPLLREQFGAPVPGVNHREAAAERLLDANEDTRAEQAARRRLL